MSRPVEIDRARAFRKAYALFWDQGYQATSLQQLLDTMGIGRSSFYAAFDSKQALFDQVILQYRLQAVERFERLRVRERGLGVVRGFVDETLINVSDRKRRMGCLAVNTVLELASVEPVLFRQANDMLENLRVLLEEEFEAAKQQGQLPAVSSAYELSYLFLTFLQGLRVASRRALGADEARRAMDGFFTLMQRP